MVDFLNMPGMPKINGGTWSNGAITPFVADTGIKMNELAGAIDWGAKFETPTSLEPKNFGALTNGTFSQSMSTAMSDFSKNIDLKFDTISNGMGAAEISKLLEDNGSSSGGIRKFGVKLVSRTSGEFIIFKVMPTISESRSAAYDDVMMPHHP